MPVEDFLPAYDIREHHAIEVAAAPGRAFRAIFEVDLTRSNLIRVLFAARGLPWRGPLRLPDLTGLGFVLLAEEPDIEVVYGLVGRFWQLRGDLREVSPDLFASFSDPGYAKAVWNFRVDPANGSRSTVSTETRVVTTDPASRRSFARYWRLIGPFSAIIRRRLLALIREEVASG